jgi:hypothetical protein
LSEHMCKLLRHEIQKWPTNLRWWPHNKNTCSLIISSVWSPSFLTNKMYYFPVMSASKALTWFIIQWNLCNLFLFCVYDSSVLQNFKIFTHLLPNFSYKDPRLTEVTYHCINFNDRQTVETRNPKMADQFTVMTSQQKYM